MLRELCVVGALASLLPGCNLAKVEAQAPFEVVIHVVSDPGHPLPGAIVMKGGKEGPQTGTDGRVTVPIPGQEGEQVDLTIKCPSDYVSPTKPITVLLRRYVGTKLPEFEAACPPAVRHMVVAIRADNGPNLPVKILDKVVGYTDAAGAFTYALPLRTGDGIEVMLDTSGAPRLSPKNPSKPLTMAAYDDILTFDQKFQVAEEKHVYRRKQVPVEIKGPHRGWP
jgi:hypothetical protein